MKVTPPPVEARHWEKLAERRVRCLLCPHHCSIADGKFGICQGRQNQDGKLYATNYGQTVSVALDPIEKKPLYHFHPGAQILSVAPNGCNLQCPFCQNWTISQKRAPTEYIAPEAMAALLDRYDSIGISYTYTEPLIWFEYLMDVCPLVRKRGGKNVLVTNGLIEEGPLRELLPYIDAMNIDLKSIRPSFYRKIVKGDLEVVKRTIEIARRPCHVEITNLLVPTLNDGKEEIAELVDYVAGLGRTSILHFSRCFPQYRSNLPPTPGETLRFAYECARAKLDYVYVGNIDLAANNTHCPQCQNLLVERQYFSARVVGIADHKCDRCGRPVDIVL